MTSPTARRKPRPPRFSDVAVDQPMYATAPAAPIIFSHTARPDLPHTAAAPADPPVFLGPPLEHVDEQ